MAKAFNQEKEILLDDAKIAVLFGRIGQAPSKSRLWSTFP
jgi:hypothetical protein